MNFLPKTLLDRQDLKRTVNSLILEENAAPVPQIIPGTSSVSAQKPAQQEDPFSLSQKSQPAPSQKSQQQQPPAPSQNASQSAAQQPPASTSALGGGAGAASQKQNLPSQGNK